MITYRDGDLFASGLPALAHGVNCEGVMGAGIAMQFRHRWPAMYEAYRQRCIIGEIAPGDVMPYQVNHRLMVFNLATQQEPGACAQPWMIAAAVGRMIWAAAYYYRVHRITEIGLPMIGCGIGGLAEDDLRAALAPYENAPVNLTVFRWGP